MRSKLLNDQGERTYALVFDSGDEPVSLLERFAVEHRLTAARFTAIGAFSEAVLGYFDWQGTESPAHLKKRHDPDSGLALIRID